MVPLAHCGMVVFRCFRSLLPFFPSSCGTVITHFLSCRSEDAVRTNAFQFVKVIVRDEESEWRVCENFQGSSHAFFAFAFRLPSVRMA
jgi:hypothetical protein